MLERASNDRSRADHRTRRPAFARFVRRAVRPAARRLGWRAAETQPDDERFLREAILLALGDLGEDGPTLRRRGGAHAPGSIQPAGDMRIWRASRCRSPPSAATRRCSTRWDVVKQPRRPRPA
jgi:hypothetical protein